MTKKSQHTPAAVIASRMALAHLKRGHIERFAEITGMDIPDIRSDVFTAADTAVKILVEAIHRMDTQVVDAAVAEARTLRADSKDKILLRLTVRPPSADDLARLKAHIKNVLGPEIGNRVVLMSPDIVHADNERPQN